MIKLLLNMKVFKMHITRKYNFLIASLFPSYMLLQVSESCLPYFVKHLESIENSVSTMDVDHTADNKYTIDSVLMLTRTGKQVRKVYTYT